VYAGPYYPNEHLKGAREIIRSYHCHCKVKFTLDVIKTLIKP